MGKIERRLQRLERIEGSADPAPLACVVIYNSLTLEPLGPVDWRSEVQVWIPYNNREPWPLVATVEHNGTYISLPGSFIN